MSCHTSRSTISRNSVSRRSATVGGCWLPWRPAWCGRNGSQDATRARGSSTRPPGDHPPGSGASAERRQITVLLTPRRRGRRSRSSPAEPALPSIPEHTSAERHSRGTATEIVGRCPIPARDPKCLAGQRHHSIPASRRVRPPRCAFCCASSQWRPSKNRFGSRGGRIDIIQAARIHT